jgi:hypothetical protein
MIANRSRPWTAHRIFIWHPDERLGEEICEENNARVEPGTGHGEVGIYRESAPAR